MAGMTWARFAWSSLGLLACAAAQETVVVRPKEIHDVLVNPGMGIQTFQRFNGDAINPGKKWSEQGPERAAARGAEKPDFPKSSAAYFRWFWLQIEPEQGKYRWEIIDRALDGARERGQKLMISIMPYDDGHPLPEWYRTSGARRANTDADPVWKAWAPDAGDPLYLKHWGALVRELAARYDGHPYMDSVDISTVGYWGEGWGPYLPGWETQKALLDLYLDNFKRTPLVVNFDELPVLRYATQNGAGWRLDCWGDTAGEYWDSWGRRLAHMLDVYPQQLVRAGAQDVWQRSPVSLETCWTPIYWKEHKLDLYYILEQALRWHASTVNIKSTAIPEEWKGRFDEFQKKIGYRFVLRRIEYPKTVKAGQMVPVSMWWLNAGVAPPYQEYWPAMELRSASGSAVIRLPADVLKWLPGDAVVDTSIYVPDDLKPGEYRVRVALLDPRTKEPAIKLAIEGRQSDGWYDVGEVRVESAN